ncbi:hypothetical protein [Clostridium lundense]|uniref:hypothetical protein n=1 Tax=Clostridium lundense TaxID=319475 RepID=UPI00047F1F82|nr:hypothetical protein [Clostridium lundense]
MDDREKKSCNAIEKENRIDELINLVEKNTRTERHLEQHSDISSPSRLESAKELLNTRQENIETLKDKIIYDDGGPTDERENLVKNMAFTEGYIEHNSDHMSNEQLQNMKEKQQNRKDKLNELS